MFKINSESVSTSNPNVIMWNLIKLDVSPKLTMFFPVRKLRKPQVLPDLYKAEFFSYLQTQLLENGNLGERL